MATKTKSKKRKAPRRRTFFNTPWDQRAGWEKGVVIGGSLIALYGGYRLIKWAVAPKSPPRLDPWAQGSGAFPWNSSSSSSGSYSLSFDPRPILDQIAELTVGWNVMYYPDVVNKIVQFDPATLKYADDYWRATYGGGMGLRSHLEGEWHAGYYDPAINKLKAAGL